MGHHYVPKFLLRSWASNGQLVSYTWDKHNKRVREDPKAGVNKSCQVKNLNILLGVSREDSGWVETFFANIIDTPASKIHKKMLRHGIAHLTEAERISWAKFLISLPARTPKVLLEYGRSEAEKGLEYGMASMRAPPKMDAAANEEIMRRRPIYLNDWPRRAATEYPLDPSKFNVIAAMEWWVERFDESRLLIGDQPWLVHPYRTRYGGFPLDNPDLIVGLPIAPTAFFVAASRKEMNVHFLNKEPEVLVTSINDGTISVCEKVFASDTSMRDFIIPGIMRRLSESTTV
jgi:hypothetical protein